jgi:beta-phosphoglucomutase-like phosphatase (HAD superfamily)
MLKALIFDVDGTLADTEEAHRDAFNAAFHEAGFDWYWSEALYTGLLEVSGGKERIRHYWELVDPRGAAASDADATIDAVHALKTRHYDRLAGEGRLALRPGILRLIREAQDARLAMAIATTTTPANVDALLRTPLGSDWRALFSAVCDAGTSLGKKPAAKKPAPDVYHCALAALSLPAADCLAFEDSANGLLAARAAGIPTLVTPTAYTRGQCFDGALLILDDLGEADLAALRRWHAGTDM